MGNPGGSLGGDWEGEEDGDADRRPLELRRLLLSGEVVALLSGEGSGCDAVAGRVAFPLKISAACHHEWRVVVTVLEAAVRAAANQHAHQLEEPAA